MDKPFVLSVEGPRYVDREIWTTHKILGAFESAEAAQERVGTLGMDDEDIVLLTNLETGLRCRLDG